MKRSGKADLEKKTAKRFRQVMTGTQAAEGARHDMVHSGPRGF